MPAAAADESDPAETAVCFALEGTLVHTDRDAVGASPGAEAALAGLAAD